MSDDRKDLPPAGAPNFNERLRETLQTYLGMRGDKLDRGVTLRDLSEANIVALSKGFLAGVGGRGSPIAGAGAAVTGAYEPDLTPPPTPEGFMASAAISNLLIECAAQTYPQGHGHARTVVYGATWVSGPLPTFASAVKITEFTGTVFSHPTNPATTWHLWIKWQSVDGVLSANPAGGTNGLVAATGQDVSKLVAAMTGAGNPFKVVSSPTTLPDGTAVPAGTYTSDAYMGSFVAARGQIGLLAVDDARVANLSAAKLTAGSVAVGQYIQSTGFVSGTSGWYIGGNGSAEFGAAYIRGQLTASQIDARGLTIRDANNNIILNSGAPLQSQINPYSSGATVGADWGTNVSGAAGVNATIANNTARLTTRTNLVYNGGFENGFSGWIGNTGSLTIQDGLWGRVAIGTNIASGTGVIAQNNYFTVQPSEWYTVTGDSLLLNNTAGYVYFDIEWLSSGLGIISDSNQVAISAQHDFSAGDTNRLAHAVNIQAPVNAAFGRVRFVWEAIAGTGVIVGCRQIKVERGILPATPYTADATLPVLQSIANAAKSSADTSAATLANISSDSVLSRGEKPDAIIEYQKIYNDANGINTQADALGVPRAAYNNRIGNLQDYLGGLSPQWNDTNQDTPIDGNTFRQKFLDVYYEKQQLLNAIAAKAATLANWSSVSGAGKPENNATVGANTSNLNVGLGTGNKLSNSGPYPDDIGKFSLGYNSTGKTPQAVRASWDQWRPTRQGGVCLEFLPANSPASGVCDINDSPGKRYPVEAGKQYEASVYLSTHRCTGYINIAWFDTAGNYITEGGGNGVNNSQAQDQLSNWPRSVVFLTAPANAATATVYVRSSYNGQNNPFTFASMWYFGDALPSQTVASPWVDGGGAAFGQNISGQITPDNASSYIASAAIGLAQIKVASIGSLSALTATIGTLRTATSGARMEIRDNVLKVYDENNMLRVQLGDLSI